MHSVALCQENNFAKDSKTFCWKNLILYAIEKIVMNVTIVLNITFIHLSIILFNFLFYIKSILILGEVGEGVGGKLYGKDKNIKFILI